MCLRACSNNKGNDMGGGGMFDGLFMGLVLAGAVLGLAMAGICWFFYWLWCHIDIVWIP